MDSVWLVWTGCYSSRDVMGVCTSEDKAKRLAEIWRAMGESDVDVQEMPLDTEVDAFARGLAPYTVTVIEGKMTIEPSRAIQGCTRIMHDGSYVECLVWARDEVHARHIAGDILAEHAAMQRPPRRPPDPPVRPFETHIHREVVDGREVLTIVDGPNPSTV